MTKAKELNSPVNLSVRPRPRARPLCPPPPLNPHIILTGLRLADQESNACFGVPDLNATVRTQREVRAPYQKNFPRDGTRVGVEDITGLQSLATCATVGVPIIKGS